MDKVAPAPAGQVPPPPEEGGGRRGPRAVWTVVDCVGVFALTPVASVALFLLGSLVAAGVSDGPGGLSSGVSAVLSGATVFLLMIAAAFTWVRLRYPGHARDLLGWAWPTRRDVLVGVGIGLLGFVVINVGLGSLAELLARLAGREAPAVQEGYQELVRNPQTAPLFIGMAVVLAPLAEELFFRGMLFPALARRMSVWAAIVVSAVLFALLHVGTGATAELGANALLAALIFPLGVLLAWAYHRRGTLVVPILIHAIFNLMAVAGMMVL